MKTYQLTIDDKVPIGQSVLALLKSIGNNIVTLVPATSKVRKTTKELEDGDTKEAVIANLKQSFKELKLIKAGKLKGRSADELLKEL